MSVLHTVILSIIEGITEFLPISSTGHMILAGHVLGIESTNFTKSFEIIIQLGAILAVVLLYAKTLWKNFDLIKKVIVAFLPTAVLGLVFYKIIKTYLLGNSAVTIAALFIGGIVIIWFENRLGKIPGQSKGVDEANLVGQATHKPITYKQAIYIGLAQSVAMIPGVSLSAATIIGGELLGLSRATIVEFSFILAIPTMAAATALDLYKNYQLFSSADFGVLALGFVVTFIVATIAVKTFLKYIQKHNLSVFGWYRIALAALSTIVFLNF